MSVLVKSENVTFTDEFITANYEYHTVTAKKVDGSVVAAPQTKQYTFRTTKKVPKLGLMLVGWGGNNGSTVTAGIIANREKMSWQDKDGKHTADYFGSLTQASTVHIGVDPETAEDVWVPFNHILPMVHPNDLEIGGWDISEKNLAEAMVRAKVLDIDLQRQVAPLMQDMVPLPAVFYPEFIASNQKTRATNVLSGTDKWAHVEQIRKDIRAFKSKSGVDKVILLWTANTERYCDIVSGINDTADNLLQAIRDSHPEVSPSTVYAVASVLEHCTYINGSPQNTFVPGLIDLAERERVFIGGDDFKSGQTKMKSVLVDFLVSSGIKPVSLVSYNHLGNNDGFNLSSPLQFRSKEISKSNVVNDMVESNPILYREGEYPDHVVVIKYVPAVGDSKRAMDEFTSKIFMNGTNTISMHNTCEDSLLAAPIILDLVILAEIFDRIEYKNDKTQGFEKFFCVLSQLAFMSKAPLTNRDEPVVNALFKQRALLENLFRACIGLQPQNHMGLQYKTKC